MDDSSEEANQFEPPPAIRKSTRAVNNLSPHQKEVRCQCGTNNTDNRLIKCVECEKWQHAICMSVMPLDIIMTYKCEMCEPRLLMVSRSQARAYQGVEPEPREVRKKGRNQSVNLEEFLEFLSEASENISRPLALTTLFEDYKEHINYPQSVRILRKQLESNLLETISMSPNYYADRKAQMLFAMGLRVKGEFLERLERNAVVEVDGYHRITFYKSKNLEFRGKHRVGRFPLVNRRKSAESTSQQHGNSGEEDDDDIFIDLVVPVTGNSRWNQFPVKQEIPDEQSFGSASTLPNAEIEPNLQYSLSDTMTTGSASTWNMAATPPSEMRGIMMESMNGLHALQSASYPPYQEMQEMLCVQHTMMKSMHEIIKTQSDFYREMFKTRAIAGAPPAPATTSLRTFLHFLKGYVDYLESEQLVDCSRLTQQHLETCRAADKLISMEKLLTGLAVATTIAEAHLSDVSAIINGASAMEFYKFIEIYASNQSNSAFSGLCTDLKQKIQALVNMDKKIPFKELSRAFRTAISLVSQ